MSTQVYVWAAQRHSDKSFRCGPSCPGLSVVALLGWTLLTGVPSEAGAATVWTGPFTNFSKAAFADPKLASNQDHLTANVWITRGPSQGLYNAKTETSFTHFSSPADTEWATGTTSNYSSLSYTDWDTWAKNINGGPPSTIGKHAVVHLKSDDIYLDIMFTSWGGGGTGGAFAYSRSTPASKNLPPLVAITNPTNGATFYSSATVTIQATASDADGTVTNVQFFDGTESLGTVSSPPFQMSVQLAVGSHTLTATATDNQGATTTSGPVTVNIITNTPLSVAITNPTNGATFVSPVTVTLQATAVEAPGTITNVQFLDGSASLGNVSTNPYELAISLAVGPHAFKAVATDNAGSSATSAPVKVTVIANSRPSVTITSPTNGATFAAPAKILVQAAATDTNGSISQVQFFTDTNLLGIVTSSPYVFTISNLAAGTYSLRAVAVDNLNATSTNSIVVIVINPPPAAFSLSKAIINGDQFSFLFKTQTGYTYAVQSTSNLNRTNWVALTNVVGAGSTVAITNSLLTNRHQFYRVRAH